MDGATGIRSESSAFSIFSSPFEAIAKLTGTTNEISDYDDAGRPIRRWFGQMWEPGARH